MRYTPPVPSPPGRAGTGGEAGERVEWGWFRERRRRGESPVGGLCAGSGAWRCELAVRLWDNVTGMPGK